MEQRSRLKPYFLTILGAILVGLSGCSEDFFNEKAGDRITPDQHYQSIIDADISLRGAIINLQDVMPNLIMLDGLRSDMMEVTNNADANLKDINNQIFSPGNPYTSTADLYKVIININEVLANIDSVAKYDRTYDEFIAFYVRGALIGMRSWTYLTLSRLYGQVTYIEDNLVSLPENLAQTVMTKAVLMDTLINQITPYIHDNATAGEFVELKIDRYVNTKALLGEIYLEINDYANAAYYLKLACESYSNNAYLLKVDNSNKDAAWQYIFLNAESVFLENLSVIPYSSDDDQYNRLAGWMGHSFDYVVRPTQVLVDSFNSQVSALGTVGDIWRGLGVTFGVDTLAYINDSTFITENYITKYEIDKSEPFSSDIIISRAADIHLMLAEALNRLGDPESQKNALMLLNKGVNDESVKPPEYAKWSRNNGIRGRVSLDYRLIPETMSADSVTLLIEDFIMAERALELAFEGKRWNDLVRVADRRGEPKYLADKVAEKFKGTGMYDEIHGKLMIPANWYLPVE